MKYVYFFASHICSRNIHLDFFFRLNFISIIILDCNIISFVLLKFFSFRINYFFHSPFNRNRFYRFCIHLSSFRQSSFRYCDRNDCSVRSFCGQNLLWHVNFFCSFISFFFIQSLLICFIWPFFFRCMLIRLVSLLPNILLRLFRFITSRVLVIFTLLRYLLIYDFDSGILIYLEFVVAVFHQLERCFFVWHLVHCGYLISVVSFNFKLGFSIFIRL